MSPYVLRAAVKTHVPTVACGDSLDWKGLTPEDIQKRVLSKVKNGSIILLHNGAKHTAEALPSLLCELKNQGYEFVTVSELIYKDNYEIDNTGMQIAK